MSPERRRLDEVPARTGRIEILASFARVGVTGNHAHQRPVGTKGFDHPVQVVESVLPNISFSARTASMDGSRERASSVNRSRRKSNRPSEIGFRFYFFLADRSQCEELSPSIIS